MARHVASGVADRDVALFLEQATKAVAAGGGGEWMDVPGFV